MTRLAECSAEPVNEPITGMTVDTQQLSSKTYDAISRRLVAARLSTDPLQEFPIQLPTTLEQAYAIQGMSIERWPDQVAGWKVAKLSPQDSARLGAERLTGPVFKSAIETVAPGGSLVWPVYEGGFAAVEAEIVLMLGKTVPPVRREYSDVELVGLVSAAYAGAEVASSPMAAVNERGPTSIISDFGNNAGVIVGPEIPDWSTRRPGFLTVTVIVDDAIVGEKPADAIVGDPLQALRVLVETCAQRGIELPAGTLVSSGAVTGVHDVTITSIARIDFGPLGRFDLTFAPRQPMG